MKHSFYNEIMETFPFSGRPTSTSLCGSLQIYLFLPMSRSVFLKGPILETNTHPNLGSDHYIPPRRGVRRTPLHDSLTVNRQAASFPDHYIPPRRGVWHTPLHDSLTVNRQALSKTNTSTRVGVGLYSQIITPRVIFAATASLPGNPKTHPSDRGIQPMSDNKTKSSFFPCPGPFFVQGPNPPIEYSPPNSIWEAFEFSL